MDRLADIAITPAGPGDADELGAVHVAAWRETYAGLLPAAYLAAMNPRMHARRWRHHLTRAKPGEVVLAAEGPRGLVGYAAGAMDEGDGEAEVHTLYLLKSAQGFGLGARLLGATAKVFAAGGARSLRLWVLAGNDRAQGFYAHLGGRTGPARIAAGWGGRFREIACRWDDIRTLTDRS